MVLGAVLVGFGVVLRAHRGANVFQAANNVLAGIDKRAIAREWLIFLGCFLVGLALVPLALWLTRAAPELLRPRELLTPLAQQARELIRDPEFQSLPPERKGTVFRAFASKVDPGFAQLGEIEQLRVTAEVIGTHEPPPNLGRVYTDFFIGFTKGAWLLTLIPWGVVQLVRSVLWAIAAVRRTS